MDSKDILWIIFLIWNLGLAELKRTGIFKGKEIKIICSTCGDLNNIPYDINQRFKLSCNPDCENLQQTMMAWSFSSNGTIIGGCPRKRLHETCTVPPNRLRPASEIRIVVKSGNETIITAKIFTEKQFLLNCAVHPPSGNYLTERRLSCNQVDKRIKKLKVRAKGPFNGVYIAEGKEPGTIVFLCSDARKIYVEAWTDRLKTSQELSVTSSSFLKDILNVSPALLEHVETFWKDVTTIYSMIQRAIILCDGFDKLEGNHQTIEAFIFQMKHEILRSINSVITHGTANILDEFVDIVLWQNKRFPANFRTPLYTEASKLCRKIAEFKDKSTKGKKTSRTSKQLLRCVFAEIPDLSMRNLDCLKIPNPAISDRLEILKKGNSANGQRKTTNPPLPKLISTFSNTNMKAEPGKKLKFIISISPPPENLKLKRSWKCLKNSVNACKKLQIHKEENGLKYVVIVPEQELDSGTHWEISFAYVSQYGDCRSVTQTILVPQSTTETNTFTVTAAETTTFSVINLSPITQTNVTLETTKAKTAIAELTAPSKISSSLNLTTLATPTRSTVSYRILPSLTQAFSTTTGETTSIQSISLQVSSNQNLSTSAITEKSTEVKSTSLQTSPSVNLITSLTTGKSTAAGSTQPEVVSSESPSAATITEKNTSAISTALKHSSRIKLSPPKISTKRTTRPTEESTALQYSLSLSFTTPTIIEKGTKIVLEGLNISASRSSTTPEISQESTTIESTALQNSTSVRQAILSVTPMNTTAESTPLQVLPPTPTVAEINTIEKSTFFEDSFSLSLTTPKTKKSTTSESTSHQTSSIISVAYTEESEKSTTIESTVLQNLSSISLPPLATSNKNATVKSTLLQVLPSEKLSISPITEKSITEETTAFEYSSPISQSTSGTNGKSTTVESTTFDEYSSINLTTPITTTKNTTTESMAFPVSPTIALITSGTSGESTTIKTMTSEYSFPISTTTSAITQKITTMESMALYSSSQIPTNLTVTDKSSTVEKSTSESIFFEKSSSITTSKTTSKISMTESVALQPLSTISMVASGTNEKSTTVESMVLQSSVTPSLATLATTKYGTTAEESATKESTAFKELSSINLNTTPKTTKSTSTDTTKFKVSPTTSIFDAETNDNIAKVESVLLESSSSIILTFPTTTPKSTITESMRFQASPTIRLVTPDTSAKSAIETTTPKDSSLIYSTTSAIAQKSTTAESSEFDSSLISMTNPAITDKGPTAEESTTEELTSFEGSSSINLTISRTIANISTTESVAFQAISTIGPIVSTEIGNSTTAESRVIQGSASLKPALLLTTDKSTVPEENATKESSPFEKSSYTPSTTAKNTTTESTVAQVLSTIGLDTAETNEKSMTAKPTISEGSSSIGLTTPITTMKSTVIESTPFQASSTVSLVTPVTSGKSTIKSMMSKVSPSISFPISEITQENATTELKTLDSNSINLTNPEIIDINVTAEGSITKELEASSLISLTSLITAKRPTTESVAFLASSTISLMASGRNKESTKIESAILQSSASLTPETTNKSAAIGKKTTEKSTTFLESSLISPNVSSTPTESTTRQSTSVQISSITAFDTTETNEKITAAEPTVFEGSSSINITTPITAAKSKTTGSTVLPASSAISIVASGRIGKSTTVEATMLQDSKSLVTPVITAKSGTAKKVTTERSFMLEGLSEISSTTLIKTAKTPLTVPTAFQDLSSIGLATWGTSGKIITEGSTELEESSSISLTNPLTTTQSTATKSTPFQISSIINPSTLEKGRKNTEAELTIESLSQSLTSTKPITRSTTAKSTAFEVLSTINLPTSGTTEKVRTESPVSKNVSSVNRITPTITAKSTTAESTPLQVLPSKTLFTPGISGLGTAEESTELETVFSTLTTESSMETATPVSSTIKMATSGSNKKTLTKELTALEGSSSISSTTPALTTKNTAIESTLFSMLPTSIVTTSGTSGKSTAVESKMFTDSSLVGLKISTVTQKSTTAESLLQNLSSRLAPIATTDKITTAEKGTTEESTTFADASSVGPTTVAALKTNPMIESTTFQVSSALGLNTLATSGKTTTAESTTFEESSIISPTTQITTTKTTTAQSGIFPALSSTILNGYSVSSATFAINQKSTAAEPTTLQILSPLSLSTASKTRGTTAEKGTAEESTTIEESSSISLATLTTTATSPTIESTAFQVSSTIRLNASGTSVKPTTAESTTFEESSSINLTTPITTTKCTTAESTTFPALSAKTMTTLATGGKSTTEEFTVLNDSSLVKLATSAITQKSRTLQSTTLQDSFSPSLVITASTGKSTTIEKKTAEQSVTFEYATSISLATTAINKPMLESTAFQISSTAGLDTTETSGKTATVESTTFEQSFPVSFTTPTTVKITSAESTPFPSTITMATLEPSGKRTTLELALLKDSSLASLATSKIAQKSMTTESTLLQDSSSIGLSATTSADKSTTAKQIPQQILSTRMLSTPVSNNKSTTKESTEFEDSSSIRLTIPTTGEESIVKESTEFQASSTIHPDTTSEKEGNATVGSTVLQNTSSGHLSTSKITQERTIAQGTTLEDLSSAILLTTVTSEEESATFQDSSLLSVTIPAISKQAESTTFEVSPKTVLTTLETSGKSTTEKSKSLPNSTLMSLATLSVTQKTITAESTALQHSSSLSLVTSSITDKKTTEEEEEEELTELQALSSVGFTVSAVSVQSATNKTVVFKNLTSSSMTTPTKRTKTQSKALQDSSTINLVTPETSGESSIKEFTLEDLSAVNLATSAVTQKSTTVESTLLKDSSLLILPTTKTTTSDKGAIAETSLLQVLPSTGLSSVTDEKSTSIISIGPATGTSRKSTKVKSTLLQDSSSLSLTTPAIAQPKTTAESTVVGTTAESTATVSISPTPNLVPSAPTDKSTTVKLIAIKTLSSASIGTLGTESNVLQESPLLNMSTPAMTQKSITLESNVSQVLSSASLVTTATTQRSKTATATTLPDLSSLSLAIAETTEKSTTAEFTALQDLSSIGPSTLATPEKTITAESATFQEASSLSLIIPLTTEKNTSESTKHQVLPPFNMTTSTITQKSTSLAVPATTRKNTTLISATYQVSPSDSLATAAIPQKSTLLKSTAFQVLPSINFSTVTTTIKSAANGSTVLQNVSTLTPATFTIPEKESTESTALKEAFSLSLATLATSEKSTTPKSTTLKDSSFSLKTPAITEKITAAESTAFHLPSISLSTQVKTEKSTTEVQNLPSVTTTAQRITKEKSAESTALHDSTSLKMLTPIEKRTTEELTLQQFSPSIRAVTTKKSMTAESTLQNLSSLSLSVPTLTLTDTTTVKTETFRHSSLLNLATAATKGRTAKVETSALEDSSSVSYAPMAIDQKSTVAESTTEGKTSIAVTLEIPSLTSLATSTSTTKGIITEPTILHDLSRSSQTVSEKHSTVKTDAFQMSSSLNLTTPATTPKSISVESVTLHYTPVEAVTLAASPITEKITTKSVAVQNVSLVTPAKTEKLTKLESTASVRLTTPITTRKVITKKSTKLQDLSSLRLSPSVTMKENATLKTEEYEISALLSTSTPATSRKTTTPELKTLQDLSSVSQTPPIITQKSTRAKSTGLQGISSITLATHAMTQKRTTVADKGKTIESATFHVSFPPSHATSRTTQKLTTESTALQGSSTFSVAIPAITVKNTTIRSTSFQGSSSARRGTLSTIKINTTAIPSATASTKGAPSTTPVIPLATERSIPGITSARESPLLLSTAPIIAKRSNATSPPKTITYTKVLKGFTFNISTTRPSSSATIKSIMTNKTTTSARLSSTTRPFELRTTQVPTKKEAVVSSGYKVKCFKNCNPKGTNFQQPAAYNVECPEKCDRLHWTFKTKNASFSLEQEPGDPLVIEPYSLSPGNVYDIMVEDANRGLTIATLSLKTLNLPLVDGCYATPKIGNTDTSFHVKCNRHENGFLFEIYKEIDGRDFSLTTSKGIGGLHFFSPPTQEIKLRVYTPLGVFKDIRIGLNVTFKSVGDIEDTEEFVLKLLDDILETKDLFSRIQKMAIADSALRMVNATSKEDVELIEGLKTQYLQQMNKITSNNIYIDKIILQIISIWACHRNDEGRQILSKDLENLASKYCLKRGLSISQIIMKQPLSSWTLPEFTRDLASCISGVRNLDDYTAINIIGTKSTEFEGAYLADIVKILLEKYEEYGYRDGKAKAHLDICRNDGGDLFTIAVTVPSVKIKNYCISNICIKSLITYKLLEENPINDLKSAEVTMKAIDHLIDDGDTTYSKNEDFIGKIAQVCQIVEDQVENLNESTNSISSLLKKCLSLTPESESYERKTEEEDEVIEEDNPDSPSEFQLSSKLEDECLRQTAKIVNVRAKSSKSPSAEGPILNTTIFKETGDTFSKIEIKAKGIKMKFPTDLAHKRQTYEMRICSLPAPKGSPISSDVIAVLKLRDSATSEAVESFKNPYKISFMIHNTAKRRLGRLRRPVPKKFPNGTISNDSTRENTIHIFRIDVPKKSNFVIEFFNLMKNESYEVVLLEYEYPTTEHFHNARIVNRKQSTINSYFKEDYNTIFFLGIRRTNESGVLKENIYYSIYVPLCLTYKNNTWEYACSGKVSKNLKKLTCRCYHFSIMAAVIEDIDSSEIEEPLAVMGKVHEINSHVIAICLSILMCLYCILIIFAVNQKQNLEDDVYYLSDVPRKNRYGYIVWVRTGAKLGAGTTSMVTIRIHGEKYISNAHVLNCPDPREMFFQSASEDLFFLGSYNHLGKIEKLEIWFDATGASPSWYCDEMRICDTQTKEWSTFPVRSWFGVLNKQKTYLEIYPKEHLLKGKVNFKTFWRKVLTNNTIWKWSARSVNGLTYVERLTIMFSVIVSHYLNCFTAYCSPYFDARDSFSNYEKFTLEWGIIYIALISLALCYPSHLLLIWGFKKSNEWSEVKRIRKIKEELAALGENPSDMSLNTVENSNFKKALKNPKGFRAKYLNSLNVMCWVSLVTNLLICLSILLHLGFLLPRTTDLMWLTTVCLALWFHIIILDLFVLNFVEEWIARHQHKDKFTKLEFEKVIVNVEVQRKALYEEFGDFVLRPYIAHLYTPMNERQIKGAAILEKARRDTVNQIEDIIILVVYSFFVVALILLFNDISIFYSNEEINSLYSGMHLGSDRFLNIEFVKDFHDYMENTLITTLQSGTFTPQYDSKMKSGYTMDLATKLVGVIRLRQTRMKPNSCKVHSRMHFLNVSCRSQSHGEESTENYGPGWKVDDRNVILNRFNDMWLYHSPEELSTVPFTGKFARYDGGGYAARLGKTKQSSMKIYQYIKENKWIDEATKVIFVEFCTYNSNTKLFNFVTLIIEKSATGYLREMADVVSLDILFIPRSSQKPWLLAYTTLVVLMALKTINRIIKTRTWLYRDLWHLVDITIILLSISLSYLYLHGIEEIRSYLSEAIGDKIGNFYGFNPVTHAGRRPKILLAILVIISTLRIWDLLRFAIIFRTVERTLYFAWRPVGAVFFIHTACMLSLCKCSYLLFAHKVQHFRDIFDMLTTMALRSIHVGNVDFIFQAEVYKMFPFMVLLTIYLYIIMPFYPIVIISSYHEAIIWCHSEIYPYNVKDYIREKKRRLAAIKKNTAIRFRLEAGGNRPPTDYVYPKSNERRYASSVHASTHRMKTMCYIARCLLRNFTRHKHHKLTEKDIMLIICTVRRIRNHQPPLSERLSKEFFFKHWLKGRQFNLVDDRKITKVKDAVNKILEYNERIRHKMIGDEEIEDLQDEYPDVVRTNRKYLEDMNAKLNVINNALHCIDIDTE